MPPVTDAGTPESTPDSYKRHATRYEPTRREACLSWWESGHAPGLGWPGPGALAHRAILRQFALLLDISQTGASIALDSVPRPDDGVWIRLEGESVSDWAEAEVVGVTTTNRGPHLVRLAFRAPCPFETLRAAVCG